MRAGDRVPGWEMVAYLSSSSSSRMFRLLHSPVVARGCQYLGTERDSNVSVQPRQQSPHLPVRGDTLIFRDRQGSRGYTLPGLLTLEPQRNKMDMGTHLADLHSLLTPLFMSVGGPLYFLTLLLLLLDAPAGRCFISLYLLYISWILTNKGVHKSPDAFYYCIHWYENIDQRHTRCSYHSIHRLSFSTVEVLSSPRTPSKIPIQQPSSKCTPRSHKQRRQGSKLPSCPAMPTHTPASPSQTSSQKTPMSTSGDVRGQCQ